MLLIKHKLERDSEKFAATVAEYQLILPFEIRQKARFVAQLSPIQNSEKSTENNQEEQKQETQQQSKEVGLQLERGKILRNGDKLVAENGLVVEIVAGDQAVSTVFSDDQKTLARICYHLGNRHVPLQVEAGWCRFEQDHVLQEMVELLGGKVVNENAPFEPEAGAYSHGHSGSHAGHGSHAALAQDTKPLVTSIDDINGFQAI